MSSCACKEHDSFAKGTSYKIYKIKSKKHRQRPLQKLIGNGFLDSRAVAVCTACVQYGDEHLEEVQSVKKSKFSDALDEVNNVIDALQKGNIPRSAIVSLVSALGQCVHTGIYEDSCCVTEKFKDDIYLTSLNVHDYLSNRNEVVLTFLKAAANVTDDDNHNRKLLCIANSLDSLYKARNLNTVTPFSFSKNFITYCVTGSRLVCDLNNSVSQSGSYTTVRNWMTSKSSETIRAPGNADIITFFDNNQVLCRNWRVNYNYRSKASVITTVLHIVPSPETRLQYSPTLSPFHWLYTPRDPACLLDAVKRFLTCQLENFKNIQNCFIEKRIKKVFNEQLPDRTDMVYSLASDSDNVSRQNASSVSVNQDPYDMATSVHPADPPLASLGDPCFVNPCSYDSIGCVLKHMQDVVIRAEENGRSWSAVGCDGLPYVLGSRLIENDQSLQNLLLLPGLGHYELNMTRAIFKLLWDVVIEDLSKLLGFKSLRALHSCHMCTDHHKSFQIIRILLFGTIDEILLPYVRHCILSSHEPTLDGFFLFLESANDPNYRFLATVICTYVFALYVFRCGVRKNNQRYILAGRCQFSCLYYGLNMTMYQEIDFKDIRFRSLLPDQLSMFMQTNESFSVSGSEMAGEGGDFVLEAFNRNIQRLLPPGLPSNADCARVCRNIAPLEEVQIRNIRWNTNFKINTVYLAPENGSN